MRVKKSGSQTAANRRASPDVVEKRRSARAFNEAMLGGGPAGQDGRTERRRRRLLQELSEGVAGRGKRELKPVDVLHRVRELLELGEPLASIRKACPPRRQVDPTPAIVDGIRRLHRAHAFPVEAYRFVGIGEDILRAAGVLRSVRAERGARAGASRPKAELRKHSTDDRPGLVQGQRGAAPRRGVA